MNPVEHGKLSRGFLYYPRVTVDYRDPLVRQNDWHEICSIPMSDNTNEEQTEAARCMDCGTPFCQTHTGCPVNNLIPEWNELVSAGQWRAASERLHSTNNFPEFTGRVCPAPCESACVAGLATDSVAIKRIELAIVERAWKEGWITPRVPARRSGLSVAVVGSGPAGLAAADCLNQMGHAVSVFERDDRVGGLLTYGIPSMKLDKEAVARRVRMLASEGIRFLTGVEVGTAIDSRELRANYDAVVVCVGAAQPRNICVPGRGLGGVHFAMEFLAHNQKRLFLTSSGRLAPPRASLSHSPPSQELLSSSVMAEGRDVVVIGGGDTGTDCVGTAMRQRCRSVTNIELMRR
jgi:NAD(P)H-dependent glutamate synthase small subunit